MDDAEAIMTEQQYTCPKCFKDYTRFTIQEHYGCGVEPLEIVTAAPASSKADGVVSTGEENATLTAETVKTTDPKLAPKKRGPKPKVKTVA